MGICPYGWSRNTTPTWISTTCGPERRLLCRKSSPSIASDAAAPRVSGQNRAAILRGRKIDHRSVRRAHGENELGARSHAPERLHRQIEVPALAPGNERMIRLAPRLGCIHGGE